MTAFAANVTAADVAFAAAALVAVGVALWHGRRAP